MCNIMQETKLVGCLENCDSWIFGCVIVSSITSILYPTNIDIQQEISMLPANMSIKALFRHFFGTILEALCNVKVWKQVTDDL